ncbi:MAG: PAS domain S-box protein [bacterium]|nr:PAS domain S-box protein [bacterium]MCP5069749.1 PAS domain S-box protein [bacterium]
MVGSLVDLNETGQPGNAGWRRALALLLAAGFFALDCFMPLGVATGVPYVAVILVSLRLPSSREVLYFALGCSVLALLGIAVSPGPGGAELWKVGANRILALFAIWATAAVGLQRRSAQDALSASNESRQDREREHAISLSENQARLSGVIQSAMDGIVTVDEDQQVVVFNRAAEGLFGVSAADAIGGPLDRFLSERIRREQPDLIRRFAESGEASHRLGSVSELLGRRSDGTEFPVEASISQVKVGGERLFTAIIHDITERNRASAELAVRAEQEAVVADLGRRAFLARSFEKTIQECLETLAGTLDVEFAKVLELLPGRRELRLVAGTGWKVNPSETPPIPSDPSTQSGYTLAVDQPVVVTDLESETRFAGPVLLEAHGVRSGVSVVIYGDDGPYGVLGVHGREARQYSDSDIDFMQAIASFIGLAARRARADDLLRVTEKRAREAESLASIGTIMAGIAHDVGTPMNVIMGYADMLERSLTNPKERERATHIKEQIGRIVRLVDTLLNMARPAKSVFVPVQLDVLLDSSLFFYQEKLRRHGIAVKRSFEPVPEIRGSADRLQQLFLNLFVNAVDAMPDGGTLAVQLRPVGDHEVEVRVRDDGAGIPAADLERIFEPFFTTKQRGEGTGLGLVVSKSIVVDHGGSIEVSSGPGSGTEFRIRLPRDGHSPTPSGAD